MKGGRQHLSHHRGSHSKAAAIGSQPGSKEKPERRGIATALKKGATRKPGSEAVGLLCSKTSKSKKGTSTGIKPDELIDKMKTFAAKNHASNANLWSQSASDEDFSLQQKQQLQQYKTQITQEQQHESKESVIMKTHAIQKQRKYKLAPKSSSNFGAAQPQKTQSVQPQQMRLRQSQPDISGPLQSLKQTSNERVNDAAAFLQSNQMIVEARPAQGFRSVMTQQQVGNDKRQLKSISPKKVQKLAQQPCHMLTSSNEMRSNEAINQKAFNESNVSTKIQAQSLSQLNLPLGSREALSNGAKQQNSIQMRDYQNNVDWQNKARSFVSQDHSEATASPHNTRMHNLQVTELKSSEMTREKMKSLEQVAAHGGCAQFLYQIQSLGVTAQSPHGSVSRDKKFETKLQADRQDAYSNHFNKANDTDLGSQSHLVKGPLFKQREDIHLSPLSNQMDTRLLTRPATCAKTTLNGNTKVVGSSQPSLQDIKRCNSFLMQQKVLLNKLHDTNKLRSGTNSLERSNQLQQQHPQQNRQEQQMKSQVEEVFTPTTQEMIFKNFVDMYSQQIKASQMSQSMPKKRKTASGDIKLEQQQKASNNHCVFNVDAQHGSKLHIQDQHSNSPLNERRVLSVERQRNDSSGRNSYHNLQGFGTIKIRGSHSNQLHIQNEQKYDKRFQQVYTANQAFQGNPVGVSGPRFLRESKFPNSPQQNDTVTRSGVVILAEEIERPVLTTEAPAWQPLLQDALIMKQVHKEGKSKILPTEPQARPQGKGYGEEVLDYAIPRVLSMRTINAPPKHHSQSNPQTMREVTQTPDLQMQYPVQSPQKVLGSQRQLGSNRGCLYSNRLARNQGLLDHNKVKPDQNYKHLAQDARRSLQNSLERHSQLAGGDSILREDSLSNVEDRPIVQERACNIFGSSPAARDNRPKTAYLGQKVQSVSQLMAFSQHQVSTQQHQQQQQQAYGNLQLMNSNAPSTNFQKYTKTIGGQMRKDMFLKGDQIKYAVLESSKQTHKSLQVEQASLSSSIKQDQGTAPQNHPTTAQHASTKVASESKKEKQFKIKKVKNKRIQQVASSTGNGFFRQKGGGNQRKMSAVNKRGTAGRKAADLSTAPQVYQPQQMPVGGEGGGKDSSSLNCLENFMQQQNQKEDEQVNPLEMVIDAQEATLKLKTPEPTGAGTSSFNEYKQLFQKSANEKIQANASQQNKMTAKNAKLFGQNFVQHAQNKVSAESRKEFTLAAQRTNQHSNLKQLTSMVGGVAGSKVIQPAKATSKETASASAQAAAGGESTNQAQNLRQVQPAVPRHIVSASHNLVSALGSSLPQKEPTYDDYQSTKLLVAILRSVQTRIEDIHLIKQSLDVRVRKTRHINVDLFEDFKGRETARITKENALFQSLSNLKQSDSAMTRRQLVKHCKKIHQVFWNVIEAEEENQDVASLHKHSYLFMATELNLIQIYSDKCEKLQIFRRGHAIQAKLLEAALREKDFEINFCVALGVQKARQTFLNEVIRASKIHISLMEQNVAQIASIRRAIKTMCDSLSQRRLKIVTPNAKANKMFELLKACNHEVREQREKFQDSFEKRLELVKVRSALPVQQQQRKLGLQTSQPLGLPAKNRLHVGKVMQTPKRDTCRNTTSQVHNDSRNQKKEQSELPLENRVDRPTGHSRADLLSIKEESGAKKRNNVAPIQDAMKSILTHHYGSKISSFSADGPGGAKQALNETKTLIKGLCMRKYKWLHSFRQQVAIGFKRSYRLQSKEHLRVQNYSYYKRLPAVLRADLEDCMENHVYKHYSMKKGNEHHLTLMVESRVLKIQKFARSIFRARSRAAKTLQTRLQHLQKQRKARLILHQSPSTPLISERLQKTPQTHMPTNQSSQTQNKSFLNRGSDQQSLQKVLSSVMLPNEKLYDIKLHKRAKGDHLHQASVQILTRPLLASQSQTLTVQRFAEKQRGGENRSQEPYEEAYRDPNMNQERTLSIKNHIKVRSMPFGMMTEENDYEMEALPEQQGGLQTLKTGLWEHYGRQNLFFVVYLQRAFRRCITKKYFETRRLDAYYDTKFKQLYSVDAQDDFQARFLKRLHDTHLLTVKFDCRYLELSHGMARHNSELLQYLATHWLGAPHPTNSTEDEDKTFELRRLHVEKIFDDLNHRFALKHSQLRRKTAIDRRRLFMAHLLDSSPLL